MSINVLDEVFNCVKKVDFLLLTGGEPLLAIQAIEHLVELLKTKTVKVNKVILITNGTVLSDRVLRVLHELQKYTYLVLKLSTDIFHYLELEKKGLLNKRNDNLNRLSNGGFYNFSEYGKNELVNYFCYLTNKGRAKMLTPERLSEINYISKKKYIVNTLYDEPHPETFIEDNKVEGNITINVYGYVVSYGLSFEEEDKEAFETSFNVLDMSCKEAINAFIKRHQEIINKTNKRLVLDYNSDIKD